MSKKRMLRRRSWRCDGQNCGFALLATPKEPLRNLSRFLVSRSLRSGTTLGSPHANGCFRQMFCAGFVLLLFLLLLDTVVADDVSLPLSIVVRCNPAITVIASPTELFDTSAVVVRHNITGTRNYTITYWVEDGAGMVVRDARVTKNINAKSFTPPAVAVDTSFVLKAVLKAIDCDDEEREGETRILVKSTGRFVDEGIDEEEIVDEERERDIAAETESFIILNASFANATVLEVGVRGYRGKTLKRTVDVVVRAGEKKVGEEKLSVASRFSSFEKTMTFDVPCSSGDVFVSAQGLNTSRNTTVVRDCISGNKTGENKASASFAGAKKIGTGNITKIIGANGSVDGDIVFQSPGRKSQSYVSWILAGVAVLIAVVLILKKDAKGQKNDNFP